MKLGTIAAVVLATLVVVPASAQVRINRQVGRPEDFNRVNPHKTGLNQFDILFLHEAYAGNSMEVKMGQLAMNRGRDQWVTDFGQDMNREHTMANSEVRQVAREKHVTLGNDWPGKNAKMYNRLQGLRGGAFDRAYASANKRAHADMLTLCANEIRYGRDATVRGLATKMMASVREHQRLINTRQTMMAKSYYGRESAAQRMRGR